MTKKERTFKKEHLGQKKLHLNKKDNTILENISEVNKSLTDIQMIHLDRIVLAHPNINSLRNKIDLLADQIKGNEDVLAISETKLDNSFP